MCVRMHACERESVRTSVCVRTHEQERARVTVRLSAPDSGDSHFSVLCFGFI